MTTLDDTLKARRSRYGEFSDNAAIAQALKDIVRSRKEWEGLDATQREAIDQVFAKISRLMTGDPDYPDNWHDMAGYSTLAENHSKKKPANQQQQVPIETIPNTNLKDGYSFSDGQFIWTWNALSGRWIGAEL